MLLRLEDGAYLLVLVGLKWYARAIPAAEKRKNERPVNPHFRYCDLEKDQSTPQQNCAEKRESCLELRFDDAGGVQKTSRNTKF